MVLQRWPYDLKKPKSVALVKWLTRKGIEKIKEEHQQAITDIDNQIQAIHYENAGLRVELQAKDEQIAGLRKHFVGYLANEDKSNGITIIAKSNEEAEYPYISI